MNTTTLPTPDPVSLYTSGATVLQVAAALGCSYDVARKTLARAGVELRGQRAKERTPVASAGRCHDCGENLTRPHPSGLGMHLPGCGLGPVTS